MNTQMDTCYKCKNTFYEYDLKECEPCAVFVCLNCTISCGIALLYGEEEGTCGAWNSVLHEGCGAAELEVCDCVMGVWLGKRCENTYCDNHASQYATGCTDCDQERCADCSIAICFSCGDTSCISSECGGYCDSDSCDMELCEDCIRKCQNLVCSRGFCEHHESNIQICKTCDRYSCIDHVEHQCAVK